MKRGSEKICAGVALSKSGEVLWYSSEQAEKGKEKVSWLIQNAEANGWLARQSLKEQQKSHLKDLKEDKTSRL